MIKQRLQEKLVDFQRDIMSLSQALQAKEQACRDGEDHLLLELMLVLDAFENIFNSLEDKAETFDKSMRLRPHKLHPYSEQGQAYFGSAWR